MNVQKTLASVGLLLLATVLTSTITQAQPTGSVNGPQSTSAYMGDILDISQDGSENDWNPAVAYNSLHHEYMVLWEIWGDYGHDIWGARVSEDGRVLSSFPVGEYYFNDYSPSIAYDRVNDRYLAVWEYDASGEGTDWDIYGRFIPWDGPVAGLNPFEICIWSTNQHRPRVAYAYTQREYLVVWTNAISTPYISGRRYFDTGGSPDTDGWNISFGTEARQAPDITYNLHRNEYLVTWEQIGDGTSWDIWAVRLRGDGIVLGTGEFIIAGWPAAEQRPAAAACDQADQYLVAWQSDDGTNYSDLAIYARYLDGDAVPGSVYQIANETSEHEEEVDISCDAPGKKYFLAWQRAGDNDTYWSIRGRMAYSNETFSTIYGVKYYDTLEDREDPAVAGGKVNFLVVWEHEMSGGTYNDIRGRLIGYFVWLPAVVR